MGRVLAVVLLLGVILVACETEDTPDEAASVNDAAPEPSAAVRAADSTATGAPREPVSQTQQVVATPTQEPTAIPEPTSTVTPEPPPTETPLPPPTETPVPLPTNTPDPMGGMTLVTVTNIVDGDTIDVLIDGQKQRIRIIGVDTPETKDPNRPVMCFGAEATAFTVEMIQRAGNEVYLEKDVSDTDRYGRLLRYVWIPHDDGLRMLNQELVAQGYAQSSTYPPDVKYQDLFVEAQQQARNEGRGLWSSCGGFGVPLATSTPIPPPSAPPPPPTGGDCDPSYPSVCMPPHPPDLDCGDIPFRRFTVLQPDPHGFDRDMDGIGCESG